MDDNRFDDIIRQKLDSYEDHSFDPAALAGFHERMDGFHPVLWYQRPLSQYLVAASVALFTVVNAWLFWPSSTAPSGAGQSDAHERILLDSMNREVTRIRTQYSLVIKERDSAVQLSLRRPRTVYVQEAAKQGPGVYMGKASDIPADVYHALMVKRMIVTDQGYAWLVGPQKENGLYDRYAEVPVKAVGADYPWPQAGLKELSLRDEPGTLVALNKPKSNQISVKMRTVIEKHYMKGIGINVAPMADLGASVFSVGEGGLAPKIGANAEWVLSPKLSVETGLAYGTTTLHTDYNFQNLSLPDPDPSLGFVEAVQIRNYLASTPLAFKYRQWYSEKGQAFVRLGYTPYYSFKQEYNTTYDFDRGQRPLGPQGPMQDHHRVSAIQTVNNQGIYGSTGTISLGITRQLKNNNKIEASLFYEKSLAAVGREQVDMQLFGIRTGYWFNLR
jgi:hypothetical protein